MAHRMENGKEKRVCYISRTASERNYAHIQKEGLALVLALKKAPSLFVRELIHVIHNPLLGLFVENKAIPHLAAFRVQRLAVFLAAYKCRLEYRAGEFNGNADCLCRLPVVSREEDHFIMMIRVNMMDLDDSPLTMTGVRAETRKDPILSRVQETILNGRRKIT